MGRRRLPPIIPGSIALTLPLLLLLAIHPLALVRLVAAVQTARGGAEPAVMAGIMPDRAADDRALAASPGVRRACCRGGKRKGDGRAGENLHVFALHLDAPATPDGKRKFPAGLYRHGAK